MKQCHLCKHPTPCVEGEDKCHYHKNLAEKIKKRGEGIKKESEKRKEQNKQYAKDNKIYAAEGNICAAFHLHAETGIRCNGIANTTQHKKGRIGVLLTDRKYQTRICLAHHIWVNEHPLEAKALGLEMSRLKIEEQNITT